MTDLKRLAAENDLIDSAKNIAEQWAMETPGADLDMPDTETLRGWVRDWNMTTEAATLAMFIIDECGRIDALCREGCGEPVNHDTAGRCDLCAGLN